MIKALRVAWTEIGIGGLKPDRALDLQLGSARLPAIHSGNARCSPRSDQIKEKQRHLTRADAISRERG